MILYILRRLLSAISVIFVTLLASFLLFFVAPTDPAGTICGPRCPNQRYEDIRHSPMRSLPTRGECVRRVRLSPEPAG